MLYLLSPAKTLDLDGRIPAPVGRRATEPLFADRAQALVAQLRTLSQREVAGLMDLSDDLAALNVARYRAWQRHPADGDARPALLTFDGDVYTGLDARTLSTADLDWAQRHLVLLSGLYGLLRPLDRMQPYRLEMGTALAGPHGRDLYAFWGDTVTDWLNAQQADASRPVVVNLASQEYAKVALRPGLRARVVECVFEDWKDGRYKLIAFFAKRARGAMARWAVLHRVRTPARLAGFDADGYAFAPEASGDDRLVFRRRAA